jgi:hypothetical protein
MAEGQQSWEPVNQKIPKGNVKSKPALKIDPRGRLEPKVAPATHASPLGGGKI